eukprot:IDg23252t1
MDIKILQVYLQSKERVSLDLFITKPSPKFELSAEEYLKLLKPLYRLCDSGDLWHKKLDEHHQKDIGMRPFCSDLALYKLVEDKNLIV